jgi:hypothetical protein
LERLHAKLLGEVHGWEMRDWWLQGRADDCSLDGPVDGVSGKGDGRCLIRQFRLEHLIMPVWGEPWTGTLYEWPMRDRSVSAAVNPIYSNMESHFRSVFESFHVIVEVKCWRGLME